MTIKEIHTHKQRIDALFSKASEDRLVDDPEILNVWNRYLVVQISNYIDFSIRRILINYTESKSHPNVIKYVSKSIESQYYNLNCERMKTIVSAFNSDWATQFDSFVEDEYKLAINSIYSNRNTIVHGDPKAPINISFVRLREYYSKVCKVIEFVEELCDD